MKKLSFWRIWATSFVAMFIYGIIEVDLLTINIRYILLAAHAFVAIMWLIWADD